MHSGRFCSPGSVQGCKAFKQFLETLFSGLQSFRMVSKQFKESSQFRV